MPNHEKRLISGALHGCIGCDVVVPHSLCSKLGAKVDPKLYEIGTWIRGGPGERNGHGSTREEDNKPE